VRFVDAQDDVVLRRHAPPFFQNPATSGVLLHLFLIFGIYNTYMLLTIAVILLVLWFLGIVTSYTLGGFIHLLLVIAIITVLIRVIQGKRIV
jgi:hypothetical protein